MRTLPLLLAALATLGCIRKPREATIQDLVGMDRGADALANLGWESALAYKTPAEIKVALAERGATNVVTIESPETSTFAFVVRMNGGSVVVFRGTLELRDWLGNFKYDQVSAEATTLPGMVHEGFLNQLKSVLTRIREATGPAESAGRLFLTGHSAGGALAMLAGATLKKKYGYTIDQIATFGAPKIADSAFQAAYNEILGENTVNLVHPDDLIPRLPPHQEAEQAFSDNFLDIVGQYLRDTMRNTEYVCTGKRYILTAQNMRSATPVDCGADDRKYFERSARSKSPLASLQLWLNRTDLNRDHSMPNYQELVETNRRPAQ